MRFIEDTDFVLQEKSAICIGKFQGLHLGHQALIHEAKATGLSVVLMTFSMNPESDLFLPDEKKAIATSLGVDIMINYPFSDKLRKMSPHQFVSEILKKRCNGNYVIVGEDFRFGYQRIGDVAFLKEHEAEYDMKTIVVNKMDYDHAKISSSRIRDCIDQGECKEAWKMLGFPYFFSGEVVRGNQIGRTLDMPTANLLVAEGKRIPPKGVYATITHLDGKCYPGVTNIGNKPTIPGVNLVGIETYLFDFNQDIYGKNIRVELCEFIRPERKFSGLDELKKNMHQDQINAHKALSHIEGESLLATVVL